VGTGALNTAVDGTPIPAADNNAIVAALKQDFVPRNSSAVATANGGRLGTATYPWERANITTGYWVVGDVKMFHDFNGTLTPGQGWMKCNGNQVTEAAYDVIHGAGAWDLWITSSPIENLYLPNMNNKFPVGITDTVQTGAIAIVSEGNASHQVSLAHTHTVAAHNHKWLDQLAATNMTYDTNGSAITAVTVGGGAGTPGTQLGSRVVGGLTLYTDNKSPATDSQGSATQSIKPESIAMEFWMRII
jgi:hypothetical protein